MAETLSIDLNDQQFSLDSTIPRQRFVHSSTVNGTGDWLLLPAGVGDMLLSVDPASGTARVEYTQDSFQSIADNSAVGRGWIEGDVSAYADAVMANTVTAVRCVSSGPTDFKVSA